MTSHQVSKDELKVVNAERVSEQDAIYTNVHNMTIFECSVNTFKALMEEAGPNKALETIKPYIKMGGKWYVDLAFQRFGPQKSDVEAVAMPYYWCHCGTSNGHIKPMEIREGKAIIELNACPTMVTGGPPEICVAMSHYLSEGISEAANPAYEYVFTHHLANGDDCCRYIVKKKSDKFSLDNLGKLEKTIPLDLEQAEMDTLTEGVAFGTLSLFTLASLDAIGSQRLLNKAIPAARNTGLKFGTKLKRDIGGRTDLEILRDRLDCVCCPASQTVSPALITEIGIEKEITECPFRPLLPPNWPTASPLPEVCMQLEEVSRGLCEAMSPDYEFAFDRMMSKGDITCHWIIKKKETPDEKPKETTISDDPARMLAMRFAKGEISQEEFDKSMELLKKHKVVK